jgi:hypothetical protein
MHAAKGIRRKDSTRRLRDRPTSNTKILGDGVTIVAGDLEGIGVLCSEAALSDLNQA